MCCQPSPLSAFRNSTRSFLSWSVRFSGPNVLVQATWFLDLPPLVVVLDHFFQRLQAAVVHVRAGVGDLAQRRRLERALVLFLLGDHEAAQVGLRLVHADADVGVLAVGEVDALVATVAAGVVREEDVHAALLALGQRLLVAGLEPVVGRVAGQDGPLERGDGLGDVVDGDLLRAEDLLEARAVAGDRRRCTSRRASWACPSRSGWRSVPWPVLRATWPGRPRTGRGCRRG